MTKGPLPFDSAVATGRGDDGTTGLLFGGERIPKDDPRAEAYGTVDEAVAALGLARADLGMKERYGARSPSFGTLDETILRLQRELFVVGAELATNPAAAERLEPGRTRVSAGMVEGLGRLLVDLEAHIAMPREFVVPGETRVSATLEQARTVIRRAERRAVTLRRTGLLSEDSLVIPYLNRLADLAWILARAAEQAEQRAPRPARTARPARSARLQPTGATVDAAAAADGAAAPGTPSRGRVPANLISRPHDRRSSLVTMPPYASPTRLGVRPTTQLSTTFLTQAFLWMFIGLLVTTGVGVLIAGLPSAQFQAIYALWFPIVIGQLIIAFALSLAITRIPATIALLLFFVYAASMGVTFAVVLVAYDFGSIAAAGISSASVFAGAAAYGAITRRNLDSIGGYLVMGLVGLIVAMVVNWFLGWSTLNVIISIVGVLLFTGLTAWHVQRIQRGEIAAYTGSMEKSAVMGAFLLYLDFINLFFLLLRLFGGRR